MDKTIKVFQREFIILIFLVMTNSCVDPPEYDDGLLQNIPAIINENDYFSFTINAKNYIINESWDLLLVVRVALEIKIKTNSKLASIQVLRSRKSDVF